MGRPAKVTGLRSAAAGRDLPDDEKTELPAEKEGRFQFRSRAASLVLSLRRRRISRGPDGERLEEAPRTKQDNALDWVRFENNYYETSDPEIAEAIKSKEGYGFPGQFWALNIEKKAQDKALEDELLRKIQERPDIAERVLRRSEADSFTLPPPQE